MTSNLGSLRCTFLRKGHLRCRLEMLLFTCYVVSDWFYSMDCNPSGSSMGLSRWEYWNGLPFPSPRNLSDPGIKHTSLELTGRFFTAETSGKPMAEDEVELIGQSSWSRSSPKVGMTCTKSLHEKDPVHQQSWKEPRAAGRERRK